MEADHLRGGLLFISRKRLDILCDYFAPAQVVGGLDDRGDVRLARTFSTVFDTA